MMKKTFIPCLLLAVALLGTACFKDHQDQGSSGIAIQPDQQDRFAIIGNTLHGIAKNGSVEFDVTTASAPTISKPAPNGTINPDYLPTVFASSGTNLYMGIEGSGISIFDPKAPGVNRSLLSPKFTPCMQVIANGNYVYIAERVNSECGGITNQLSIINVSNATQPSLVKTYAMTGPQGLAADGYKLFVCDAAGLKFYDASNPANLVLLQTVTVAAKRATAQNGKLAVVTADELYQYDYTGNTLYN